MVPVREPPVVPAAGAAGSAGAGGSSAGISVGSSAGASVGSSTGAAVGASVGVADWPPQATMTIAKTAKIVTSFILFSFLIFTMLGFDEHQQINRHFVDPGCNPRLQEWSFFVKLQESRFELKTYVITRK
jgi:hypothetical protein